jgi:hypothetical protein
MLETSPDILTVQFSIARGAARASDGVKALIPFINKKYENPVN